MEKEGKQSITRTLNNFLEVCFHSKEKHQKHILPNPQGCSYLLVSEITKTDLIA